MLTDKKDIDIVETLRLKSEEADMKQYLKSNINGYTKKSVHEYLSILRKQQQSMGDAFNQNQQVLFEEKESLKKDNEALKTRLSQVEAEYRVLTEEIRKMNQRENDFAPSDTKTSDEDMSALKEELNTLVDENNKLTGQTEHKEKIIGELTLKLEESDRERISLSRKLEDQVEAHKNEKLQLEMQVRKKEDIIRDFSVKLEESCREESELLQMLEEESKKFKNEKRRLEMETEQKDSRIRDLEYKLEQSERENRSLKEKLKVQILEMAKQQETLSGLSKKAEQQDAELRQLRSQISNGRLEELNEKARDLSLQLSTQSKVLANYDNENSLKAQIIKTMSQEKETLKQSLTRMVKHIEEVNAQNERLIYANNALSEQLESEYKRYIDLIQAKPYPTLENPSTGVGWGETVSDITMLELHNNQKSSERVSTVYNNSYQDETVQPCISKEDITKCTEQTSHIIARRVSCKVSK